MAFGGGRGAALASPEPVAPFLVDADEPPLVPGAAAFWSRFGVASGFLVATSGLFGVAAGLFGVVSVLFGLLSGRFCAMFSLFAAAVEAEGDATLVFAAKTSCFSHR